MRLRRSVGDGEKERGGKCFENAHDENTTKSGASVCDVAIRSGKGVENYHKFGTNKQ